MTRIFSLTAVALLAIGLTACGSNEGETTTVIREVAAPPPADESPAPAAASSSSTSEPTGPPPNVLGLPLPAAKRLLKEAGYKTVAKNTDTAFGIVVESNYTICNQGKPRGNLVVVLAQKYGC